MKELDIIFITQTDKRSVFICILAIFLFSALITLMTIQTTAHNYNSTYFFMAGFFLLFIIGGFIGLFKFKQIVLTKNEIKIIYPFLFKTKYYNLQDIKTFKEKNYKIEPLIQESRMTIHQGKETTIEFKTSSNILTFNTLETNNYFEFIKALRQTLNKKE
ncbi:MULTISPECIES: hypothetical protein [Flavobacterium]|uniref:hypothetical protein n=1 Tax=Flavobacterium TaxID=237 RepID=UPI001FCB7A35|nr:MULTISPECIES: hypothetical protein [Flavobacterium]UOK42189.1 hypothetical protein LZF87_12825 [Flavobacterium enshiense]